MFCALTAKSCSIFLFFVLIFSLREQFKKGKLKELQICSNVHPQYIFPGLVVKEYFRQFYINRGSFDRRFDLSLF